MSLGNFSTSLNVKDIIKSKEFYEKLGFKGEFPDESHKWIIMQSEDCTIGLFEGMFDKNILTFNPGWNNKAEEVNPFKDVRDIQEELRSKDISFTSEVSLDSTGPGSFTIEDPDGNVILVDQHR